MIDPPQVRACTNCVRAKAKCNPPTLNNNTEGKCERCHRMKKVCQPSPPMRRQRIPNRPSAKLTSNLEEKLDGIVTLLESANQGSSRMINPVVHVNSLSDSVHVDSLSSQPSGSSRASYEGYTHSTSPMSGNGPAGSPFAPRMQDLVDSAAVHSLPSRPTLDPSLEPDPKDAELYLNSFRKNFAKHLPFVVIPLSLTARQLRLDRPFLWASIMTVASSNSTQQTLLSKDLRGLFAREVFLEGTRSLDLLLAILVYTNWDRCYVFGKPLVVSLIHLALAILYDLELDKPPSRDQPLPVVYDFKGYKKPGNGTRTATIEERRALLACYVLSSVSCFVSRKGQSMRWTAYCNECLRVVETEKEFETDLLLGQLVKLRVISERVQDLHNSCAATETEQVKALPMTVVFYLKSIEAQFQNFRANIPSNLSQNRKLLTQLMSMGATLLMEIYDTELSMYEIGLSKASDIFAGEPKTRIECLWGCMTAMKSCIDVYFTFTPAQYVGFSSLIYWSLLHSFLVMCRLSIFDHPEWNSALFREQFDIIKMLRKCADNFAAVKEAAGLDRGGSEAEDSFSNMAARVRVVITTWKSTLSANGIAVPNDELFELPMDFPMEVSDDDWLKGWNWSM